MLNRNSSVSDHRSQDVIQNVLPDLVDILFTEDSTAEALLNLKPNKVDASGILSEHLKFASPVIAKQIALLFTSIIRHGYMPQCLRDSVIVPIPNGNKDASCSSNYRPVILVNFLSDSSFLSMRIVSRVLHCNLVLNQASLPLCVPVQ